ncbi:MAG: hypothetical protein HKN15_02190 [Xanthomonadales bacterium]|nr:hypothetical protein [Xanthomonadales bacterium]
MHNVIVEVENFKPGWPSSTLGRCERLEDQDFNGTRDGAQRPQTPQLIQIAYF